MKKRYYLFILLCLYISKLVMEIRYGDASDSAEVKIYMAKAAETDNGSKGANKNEGAGTTLFSSSGSRNKQNVIENAGAVAAITSSPAQSTNNSVNYNLPSGGNDNGFTASVAQQHISIPVFSSVNSNAAASGSTEMPGAVSSSAQPQILASLSSGSVPASISGSGGPSAGYSNNIDALILSSGLFDSGGGNYTTMDDDDPGGDDPFPGDTSDPVPLDGGLTFLLAVGIGLGIRSFRLTKTKKDPVKESFWLLRYRMKGGLNAKLFQVMVSMFPHGKAPFTCGKFSK